MENNNVNHPSHYNRKNGIECIEEMVLVFGVEAVKNFCLCNIWKYRYRAADKNGEEDLEKSDFYMKKYRELCEEPIEKEKTFTQPIVINTPNYIPTTPTPDYPPLWYNYKAPEITCSYVANSDSSL